MDLGKRMEALWEFAGKVKRDEKSFNEWLGRMNQEHRQLLFEEITDWEEEIHRKKSLIAEERDKINELLAQDESSREESEEDESRSEESEESEDERLARLEDINDLRESSDDEDEGPVAKKNILETTEDENAGKGKAPENQSSNDTYLIVDQNCADMNAGKGKAPENKTHPLVSSTLPCNDQERVPNNEPAKRQRQRQLNSESVQVPEALTNSPASTTTPRSDSSFSGDGPKERVGVPPSPKEPTNSLRIDRFQRLREAAEKATIELETILSECRVKIPAEIASEIETAVSDLRTAMAAEDIEAIKGKLEAANKAVSKIAANNR